MDVKLYKKIRRIKCIYSDIDGTIFNSEHQITNKTKKTIRQFIKQKYIFGLISGRHWLASYDLTKTLKINGLYAGLNGAEITNIKRNDNLFKVFIDTKTVQELILFLIRENFGFMFFTENNLYYFLGHKDVFAEPINSVLIKLHPIVIPTKIVHYNEYLNLIDQILCVSVFGVNNIEKFQKITDAFGNNPNIDFTRTSYTLDIKSSKVDKGIALQQIAKIHKLSLDEILVFGNAENDLPMFNVAGTSVVMKQAGEHVIKGADFVTQYDNNQNGVACFIERYFLN